LAIAQEGARFQLLPALSVTVLTALDANMAINMFPVPVAATVTAHDVPEVAEQEVPLVTTCISLIAACAAKHNSRLRRMAFMLVRPP
jgi:hypothetical protein